MSHEDEFEEFFPLGVLVKVLHHTFGRSMPHVQRLMQEKMVLLALHGGLVLKLVPVLREAQEEGEQGSAACLQNGTCLASNTCIFATFGMRQ